MLCTTGILRRGAFFLALLFLGWGGEAQGVEDRPKYARSIVQLVHRVRTAVETPGSIIAQDHALIKAQVASLTQNRDDLRRFAQYAYGPGLLYLDEFRDDLAYLLEGLTDPTQGPAIRARLDALDFGLLALALVEVSSEGDGDDLVARLNQRIDTFEQATAETLAAEDRFAVARQKATRRLKVAQSALVILGSALGISYLHQTLGLDDMTPRELVGFLFSVWAANEGLLYVFWDKLNWIVPFHKWAAQKQYIELKEAWKRLLTINPELSAQKAGAAARSKGLSNTKRADAQTDAALEALYAGIADADTSNDKAIERELFDTFLNELELGNGPRSTEILEKLKDRNPDSEYARMSETVARIFKLRVRMERKCLFQQSMKASWRVLLLGVALWGSNEGIKYFAPDNWARWRTVPMAVLGGLGLRRILPHIWLPHRVEVFKRQATQEETELRDAFVELLAIHPSAVAIVNRIARFDSGFAAHQLVTYAAGDALAQDPDGARTRALWNAVTEELTNSHPAGSRVHHLLKNTYRAQRTCVQRLLETIQGLARQF